MGVTSIPDPDNGMRNALRGRFFHLLIGIVLMIAVYPYVDNDMAGKIILNVINLLVLVFATLAVQKSRLHLFIALSLGAVTLVGQIAYLTTGAIPAMRVAAIGALIFYVFTVVNILLFVLRSGEVTAEKIHGAICAYLIFAVMWTMAYLLLQSFVPGSFYCSTRPNPTDPLDFYQLLYFSIVTLTTTGYGDIAPLSAQARSLANLEQLVGVFYVAILIARLAGLYPPRGKPISLRN